MSGDTMEEKTIAKYVSLPQVVEVSGLTYRQVKYLVDEKLFTPSKITETRNASISHLSLPDVLTLIVAAKLREYLTWKNFREWVNLNKMRDAFAFLGEGARSATVVVLANGGTIILPKGGAFFKQKGRTVKKSHLLGDEKRDMVAFRLNKFYDRALETFVLGDLTDEEE